MPTLCFQQPQLKRVIILELTDRSKMAQLKLFKQNGRCCHLNIGHRFGLEKGTSLWTGDVEVIDIKS